MKKRLHSLIEDIEGANSQNTVDIVLDSHDIGLDYQSEFGEEHVDLVITAIKRNKRIKSLNFSNSYVSPAAACTFFETFMLCPKIESLIMPVWSIVFSNGQRPLMEMEEEFPEAVENYNNMRRTDLIAFNFFKRLNDQYFKLTSLDVTGQEVTTVCRIPTDVLLANIKSFLVAPAKKVTI